jgi:YD repeat-containing protein
MSQVSQLPPPPIAPIDRTGVPARFLILAGVLILGLFGVWELRLLNSSAGKEAAQRIRGDARVRAEFGDDVHIPFAYGWALGDQATIFARVSGKLSQGRAVVELSASKGGWEISRLEVHNQAEGHVINLAKPEAAATREQLQGTGNLYFVALGDAAKDDVNELAGFFEKEFGIHAKTLPAIPLPSEAYDARRKQWIAEMLVQAMRAKYPELEADPDSKIVGILEDDLYIYSFNWNYSYSYRNYERYSVVPTARLDPAFYRFPSSEAIRMERLRKVAMKAVGLLYLGFKESPDPQSVTATEATVEDIDRMGSVYLDSDARIRTHAGRTDTDGTPCLNFYSGTLAGAPLRTPISPCWQHTQESESTQFQIDLARGRFQLSRNDLFRGGVMPLVLQRMNFSYHFDDKVRAFGKSSWQSLDDTVWSADPNSIQTISINGTLFQRETPGNGFSPEAKYRAAEQGTSIFSAALLRWENGGWSVYTRGGEVWRYLGCGPNTRVPCYFMGLKTFRGDSLEMKRDTATGHIQSVSQKTNANLPAVVALDHTWTATYDGERITEIHDSDGRSAAYHYDSQEFLTDVEADGHKIHYDYDDAYRMTGVTEDGKEVRIHYDSEGRPERVELPGGMVYGIKYSQDAIEVNLPDKAYTVKVLPTFFRVVER